MLEWTGRSSSRGKSVLINCYCRLWEFKQGLKPRLWRIREMSMSSLKKGGEWRFLTWHELGTWTSQSQQMLEHTADLWGEIYRFIPKGEGMPPRCVHTPMKKVQWDHQRTLLRMNQCSKKEMFVWFTWLACTRGKENGTVSILVVFMFEFMHPHMKIY